jgi:hypothetical protein
VFIFRILKSYEFGIKETLFLILFSGILFWVINFLKHIKWIKIKENQFKYYSVLKPFGKKLNISDYIGKIILTESGSAGSYKVVYLVDKQNKTSFKLMGLHYKNFEEINNSINLKNIKFSPSVSQYFKLLFFEKIVIQNDEGNNNDLIIIVLSVFKLIFIIGMVLFILKLILKNLV